MPLQFYMDENVHDAIIEGMRRLGYNVLRAQDDGHGQTDDTIILDRAAFLGRILFTHDDDFLTEAHERQKTGKFFAGVVYAHQGYVPIGKCIEELEIIAIAGTMDYMANHVEYLPL